jgi:hypothetical protein
VCIITAIYCDGIRPFARQRLGKQGLKAWTVEPHTEQSIARQRLSKYLFSQQRMSTNTFSWQWKTQSESESELLYDWRFTANQFVLAPSPLRITDRISSNEHLRSYSLYNILPDERMDLSFTISTGPRQRIHSRVRVPWDSQPYFYCLRFETSLFVASYDWQDYGGAIRPHLHTVKDITE